MQTEHGRQSTAHAQISFGVLMISLTAALWMDACASSPARPTQSSCAPPIVTACDRPLPPTRLETQADLLRAYVDALAAWAACRAEVDKIIEYYRLMEVKNAEH